MPHLPAPSLAPTCCPILPPHILRSIAEHGSDSQRQDALATLATDHSVRQARAVFQAIALPPHKTLLVTGPVTKKRTIYDGHSGAALPGTLVRGEGQPATKDKAVNEAYTGLGATFDFYLAVFKRNSIDDAGLALNATVHFKSRYDNAMWTGGQMVFGDGDGQLFNRFTISLDVIGHELTHGVTGSEANLAYQDQSGALNESISDVFGSLVKQYALKQTAAQADWLIGQGLFTKKVKGVALRSMKAPGTAFNDPVLGKDPQPATMAKYVHTTDDSGGVHINSGIPNRAFYLVATKFGGNAWDKAGRIWYETLCDSSLSSGSNFQQFAKATASHAATLFGTSARQTVIASWKQVGVTI